MRLMNAVSHRVCFFTSDESRMMKHRLFAKQLWNLWLANGEGQRERFEVTKHLGLVPSSASIISGRPGRTGRNSPPSGEHARLAIRTPQSVDVKWAWTNKAISSY